MQLYKYIVLDAARMDDKIDIAKELCPKFFSLYRGNKENQLASVAPYVFDIDDSEEFQKWYFEEGWGNSWGIILYSPQDIKQIRKHLRRFLMVMTEDKKELYFRFYDPRVLRVFLPTCNTSQIKEFFGGVEYFLCEDENPETGIAFSMEGKKLNVNSILKEEAVKYNPTANKKRFSFF